MRKDDVTESNLNLSYDRNKAKEYAIRYALNPNIDKYPYFKDNDCANFVSQVLRAGGMKETGSKWDKLGSWFCKTKNTKKLDKISISWRAARYFRRYWGDEDGMGEHKAEGFYTMTVLESLQSFPRLYNLLEVGDVIQYGDPKTKCPYHTQVIYDKGYNPQVRRYDLYMAQHTANRLNISLYTYLSDLEDKETRNVYMYNIKKE